jgi:3-hydroxyisobutyrate dehydrogenase-like beta-hydroxyacid dehydrogenase
MAQLAGERIAVLDAPVSGGRRGAVEGNLTAIVADSQELVERARPWLQSVAGRVFVVGERPGLAQVCKLANNALSLTGLAIACEVVALGVKAGLDAATMIDVINAGTGRNSATADKFPRAILPRNFDTGGHVTIGAKDLGLYLQEVADQGLSPSALGDIAGMWVRAVEEFGPAADASLFMRLMEEWAGNDGGPFR